MPGGPKRKFTIEDLPKNWRELVIEGMGSGMSVIEAVRQFGLKGYSREIHARMCVDYTEYHETFEEGKMLSEAFWIAQGRENLHNNKFNNTLWIFNMKNRFAWRDTPVAPKEDGGNIFKDKTEQIEVLERFRNVKELEN